MKTIKFLFFTGIIMALWFIGIGFASGPDENNLLFNSEISLIIAEPVRALLIGAILMGVGLLGGRRFVK